MDVVTVKDELTAPKFAESLAMGIGGRVVHEYNAGPWAGFGSPGSWEGLMRARAAKEDFFYGDHGYFGRGVYYRVTKNAFQHDGRGTPDLARLRPFYERAAPWKKGKRIIVCPQSEGHHARFMAADWLSDTLEKLKAVTDRPIKVRMNKHGPRPLEADLDDAWCVVTHSSASAIHGLMHGVPAICTADCAASRMALADPFNVEYPFYPDGRVEWASVLAANQWTLEELKRGACREVFE